MLRQLYDRLKYLQPPTRQLIEQLSHMEQFAELTYLTSCNHMLRGGNPFAESWKESVYTCTDKMGKEETEILAALGDVLGSADLDSQLNAIACACTALEQRLATAKNRNETQGKLYRSLGTLGGLAAAVLLI